MAVGEKREISNPRLAGPFGSSGITCASAVAANNVPIVHWRSILLLLYCFS
jgi:hypothetical protein